MFSKAYVLRLIRSFTFFEILLLKQFTIGPRCFHREQTQNSLILSLMLGGIHCEVASYQSSLLRLTEQELFSSHTMSTWSLASPSLAYSWKDGSATFSIGWRNENGDQMISAKIRIRPYLLHRVQC